MRRVSASISTTRVTVRSRKARSCETSTTPARRPPRKPLEALETREVEVVRRLVEAEDIEAGEQDRGERCPGGLAARELADLVGRPPREPDVGQRRRSPRVEVAAAEREEAVERVAVRLGQLGLVAEPRAERVELVARRADAGAAAEVGEHRLARPRLGLLRQVADRARAHDLAASGSSTPASSRSRVDLPMPFGPTIPTRSPGPTASDTRSST